METLGVKVEPGVEHIQSGGEPLAIILSYRYREEGIRFFTPDELSQQLAFMRHPAGKLIAPHVHNPVTRGEKGQLEHHWRRRLTEDIGYPEVEKHLYTLIALERANRSWDWFYRTVQSTFSKRDDTIELNLRVKEGEPL